MLTCLRYVKSKEDAEDLVQEAFVKIFNDLHQYDASKASYLSWSKRVVINTCLMHLRKKSVFNFMDNIVGYRTVFNMFVIDGYSHSEIADKLDISESTSKTQLFKAKKQLRIDIEETDLKFIGLYA